MQWIYIFKCRHFRTDKLYYYVGVTNRLYRRFWEHRRGEGGINTSTYVPQELVALYKVDVIAKFIDYITELEREHIFIPSIFKQLKSFNDDEYVYVGDRNKIENFITECMMINHSDKWKNVRGGKYVRFDAEYTFPTNPLLTSLPICKCGLPCDIHCKDNTYLYFRCSKKNMWEDLENLFDVENSPCDYYKEFKKDIKFRTDKINKKDILRTLFKQSNWLVNVPSFESRSYKYDSGKKYAWCICSEDIADIDDDPIDIEGGCNNNYKGSMITYQNIRKCLCYDCFIQYNDELSKKYSISNNYAFIDDDDINDILEK